MAAVTPASAASHCIPRPAIKAIVAGVAIVVSGWASLVQAHSPGDPASVSEGHPTGHTSDHGDLTWPPQPRGITKVVPRGNAGDEPGIAKARELRAAALERIAMIRADVRQALGNRFTRATVLEDIGKDGVQANPVLVYFSQATNSTVEVTVEGQRVRSLRKIPAREYQPEITDEEIAEAEGIARTYFAELGEERVAQLEAFGILAYQPTGRGFFDSRVIYISFHPDNDSYPEFAAWVDLTGRRVLRTLKEQP